MPMQTAFSTILMQQVRECSIIAEKDEKRAERMREQEKETLAFRASFAKMASSLRAPVRPAFSPLVSLPDGNEMPQIGCAFSIVF